MYYKLIIGDCIKSLDLIEDYSIKSIVTSPPYNIGKDYASYSDKEQNYVYIEWLVELFKKCYQKLTMDGFIFLNMGNYAEKKTNSFQIIIELEKVGYFNKDNIIWNKTNWQPHPEKSSYLENKYEFIHVLTKKSNPEYYKNNVEKYRKIFGREKLTDVWNLSPDMGNRTNHPAVFPSLLPEICIKLSTNKDDLVLDPFLGSGTTMKVSRDLGRSCIGIEYDKQYINTIKDKVGWNQQTLNHNYNKYEIIYNKE